MSIDIIKERLREYSIQSKQEEINALKEIYQEIALAALARSDFFKILHFKALVYAVCINCVDFWKTSIFF